MSVLVSGAAGLIGRAVCDYLALQSWDVVGIDRVPAPAGWSGRWLQQELTGDDLDGIFDGVDHVVHLAAIPSPGAVPDGHLFTNNVTATFNVLNGGAAVGVRRAVIASSVSIYGLVWADRELQPAVLPLREDQELHIEDAYALSKQADENTARMVSNRSGMPILALRFPNVSDRATIIARSAAVARDIHHAHRELWAYLELVDAGRAVHAALTANTVGFDAINIVAEQPLAGLDLLDAVASMYPGVAREQLNRSCGYDTRRARELLNFTAEHIL